MYCPVFSSKVCCNSNVQHSSCLKVGPVRADIFILLNQGWEPFYIFIPRRLYFIILEIKVLYVLLWLVLIKTLFMLKLFLWNTCYLQRLEIYSKKCIYTLKKGVLNAVSRLEKIPKVWSYVWYALIKICLLFLFLSFYFLL